MARWLIYALGGGWGHLQRALALSRQANQLGHETEILSNCPYLDLVRPYLNRRPELASTQVRSVATAAIPSTSSNEGDLVRQRVRQRLAQRDYDRLVIDCFPRGLGGELADLLPVLPARKTLVVRLLQPRYVSAKGLREFAARHFDLVLQAGEPGPLAELPQAVWTPPWLICDPSDVLPEATARHLLNHHGELAPLLLVVASGPPRESARLEELALVLAELAGKISNPPAEVRFASATPQTATPVANHVRHWPLMELLAPVNLLLGSAGYNLVHEARATGTPLLARPMPRMYDLQARRLRPHEQLLPDEPILEQVRRALAGRCPAGGNAAAGGSNGARLAASLIADL